MKELAIHIIDNDMYLPLGPVTDDAAVALAKDYLSGENLGKVYNVVEREVGEWKPYSG